MALLALSMALVAEPRATDPVPDATAKQRPAAPGPAIMRKWSRSCALCHVDGTGGAPRVGRTDEWQPRLAQGRDVLFEHTVEGFNNMPPLGYCMSCEAEDFRALIDFMAGAQQ